MQAPAQQTCTHAGLCVRVQLLEMAIEEVAMADQILETANSNNNDGNNNNDSSGVMIISIITTIITTTTIVMTVMINSLSSS